MEETSMTEEEVRYHNYMAFLAKRGNMRDVILQAVDAFNAFNEREFPGQFKVATLAFKDHQGRLTEVYRR